MNEAFIAVVPVLLAVVPALLVVVFALWRRIAVLEERVAALAAWTSDCGPKVGAPSPVVSLTDLTGNPVNIGVPSVTSTLLFFLSPACPVCRKLLPMLKSTALGERRWLSIVLASSGDDADQRRLVSRAGLDALHCVPSTDLGIRYGVRRPPYAVLVDECGIVRAKGPVGSREQLESILAARNAAVPLVRDSVDQRH